MARSVTIFKGIAGSGKSTAVKKILETQKNTGLERSVVISRDEIRRNLLHEEDLSNYWKAGMDPMLEEYITSIEHQQFAQALSQDKPIIVDNTNLRPRYILAYIDIMIDFGYTPKDVTVVSFPISIETAKKRLKDRDTVPISEDVLKSQFHLFQQGWDLEQLWEKALLNHIPKKWYFPSFKIEPYFPDKDKPRAILCDLDGTLSHRVVLTSPRPHMRSYYGVEEYDTDHPDLLVRTILDAFMNLRQEHPELRLIYPLPIFVSGRKKATLNSTRTFLRDAFPAFAEGDDYLLYTRDEDIDKWRKGDAPDDRVKYRIFNQFIRNDYNVIGVMDDRRKVVALWQALGLRVANMGMLNEEF